MLESRRHVLNALVQFDEKIRLRALDLTVRVQFLSQMLQFGTIDFTSGHYLLFQLSQFHCHSRLLLLGRCSAR